MNTHTQYQNQRDYRSYKFLHFKSTLYYSSLRALLAARLLKSHFKKLHTFFGILNRADIYGIDFDGDAILDFTPERNFI